MYASCYNHVGGDFSDARKTPGMIEFASCTENRELGLILLTLYYAR